MPGADQCNAALRKLVQKMEADVLSIAERGATEAENAAKRRGPWRDRTTQARAGLTGTAGKLPGGGARIVLSHTKKHGVYLELAFGRRYAVIESALAEAARGVEQNLRNLI